MAINPCIIDSNCIDLSIDANSNLRADLIVSPNACNAITCTANGVYAVQHDSIANGVILPCDPGPPIVCGLGWSLDLSDVMDTHGVGVPVVPNAINGDPYYTWTEPATYPGGATPADTMNQVFTNTSACLSMSLVESITVREVQYAGPTGVGANFSVELESSTDGGVTWPFGYTTVFDYRFHNPGAILESRAGGASSGAAILAPLASYNWRFRFKVTLLSDPGVGPGSGYEVSCPGATGFYLGTTLT